MTPVNHQSGMGSVPRRRFLAGLATATGGATAGCGLFERAPDDATTELSVEAARELAESFAPTLYFDEHERWYPTDPRPYRTEQDGETVVDGFAALNDYTSRRSEGDPTPDPTLFYNAMQYEDSSLAVVQFWYYSVFDQFTTNFHWHDWEVLHVFTDRGTGSPQLYVASSHSDRVPNNEHLDPDPDHQPRILSELGSHSSALSINDIADRFQRLPLEGTFADITNGAIDGIEVLADLPIAYGLPRDEGSRLPYAVPTLDGATLDEHERLPDVEHEDLLTGPMTVRSFADLTAPPTDLPSRSTGLVFRHDSTADVSYDLVPTTEVEDIAAFTGPQLSFDFAVPDLVEDAVANHITTTGVPWDQPRYAGPGADISDPGHRQVLADRYDPIAPPSPGQSVVASLTAMAVTEDAPEDGGIETGSLDIEGIALLESEPAAAPTFHGVAVMQGLAAGDHRLTVNAAGVAPYSEPVRLDGPPAEPTPAGVDGRIPVVARENATKLEVDPQEREGDLSRLRVADDFAGRLYDVPVAGPDAVYLHGSGAYTAEVRDADDEPGAYRVRPRQTGRVRIDAPQTGTEPLATYVADVAAETAAELGVEGDDADGSENGINGLRRALTALADAAEGAAEHAAANRPDRAGQALSTVQDRIERVSNRLMEVADDLPAPLRRAAERRLDQVRTRADQAQAAQNR